MATFTPFTDEQKAEILANTAKMFTPTVVESEWTTPNHEEVDLTMVTPEELGLDPFDTSDPLVRKIYQTQDALIAEEGTPYFGALKMQKYGMRLIPLLPKEKVTTLKNWQELATNDLPQIGKWHKECPNANWAVVGKLEPGGHALFEIDDASVTQKIVDDTGHSLTEIQTFKTSSSPKRGHMYFVHSAESLALGNAQGKTADGKEAWSFRADNRYCVAPLSIHPKTLTPYGIRMDAPPTVIPTWLVEWCVKNQVKESVRTVEEVAVTGDKIPHGSIHPFMVSQAGRMREAGLTSAEIEPALIRIVHENCEAPIDEEKVRQVARSMNNYDAGVGFAFLGDEKAPLVTTDKIDIVLPEEASLIPAFDDSVITGIFKEIVDVATKGTTIPKQFAFLNAKVYLGAAMAGKTTFAGLDCDSSYYGCAIGATGTSKGESWRRTVERVLMPEWDTKPLVKVIHGADSGAGLKDAFFETNLPIIDYIDEVISLGHQGAEKKNPEIIDQLIQLADSHTVTRVLAKRGKAPSSRVNDNARLSAYICGQDGDAFMQAFAGRKKIGLFNRLYPEWSGEIEPGKLPTIPKAEIDDLAMKVKGMKFNSHMTMAPGLSDKLDEFWEMQHGYIKRGLRFKKTLALDTYMQAFGRGVAVAEQEDLDNAIKIFNRQMIIRKVCFTNEIPDRVGFYTGKIKVLLDKMREHLNAGAQRADVAQSIRDFQTKTNAYRDNELTPFKRAWDSLKEYLMPIRVASKNGQEYVKYIPTPDEHELW